MKHTNLDIPLADRITVTATEACALLGVSPATLRGWAQLPGFPSWTPPGARRPLYPVAELRRWVAQQAQQVAS